MTRRYHAPAWHRFVALFAALPFLPTITRAAPDSASAYVKKATWAETMVASRANLPEVEEAEDVEPAEASLGPWYATGPLSAKNFDEALFPEQGVDLKAKGPDGKRLWRQRPKLIDGKIHSLPSCGKSDSTYLFRTIQVERASELPAGFGSDDSLAVWLNGKRIVNYPKNRGVAVDSDRAVLQLAPGENRLLCKVYNIRGSHGFYFSTSIQPGSAHRALWQRIAKDFPVQCGRMQQHLGDTQLRWFDDRNSTAVEKALIGLALDELGPYRTTFEGDLQRLVEADTRASDTAWLALYERLCQFGGKLAEVDRVDVEALRLAIEDLSRTFGSRYPNGKQYLQRLAVLQKQLEQQLQRLQSASGGSDAQIAEIIEPFVALKREAMLANPLLDFDELLVLRRTFGPKATSVMSGALGLPSLNSRTHDTIPHRGWDNEIIVLGDLRGAGTLRTLYKPADGEIVTDVDLHFDGDKLMFSSIGTHDRWQILQLNTDGTGLRQLTPDDLPDVDFFDSCYLPGGKIAVTSTAVYQGLPCEGGKRPMACLYLLDPETKRLRQLTFEQDSDWCPTVLNNGRLMYLRWEYSDAPHYFTRILFHCNPDGTNQMEYYGSNSYFPNAFYYARPIPGDPNKVVGVVGGHHGIARSGRLLILDPAQGRHEANGVVQEIPGRGKPVEPIIRDRLIDGVWPQFLNPYPLSEKYHLVAAKMSEKSLWGIYLVDVFDNMTLLKEMPGAALLEPLPLRRTPTPPVIPERIDLRRSDAVVYLTDVHAGPGLQGIPRGKVDRLRLFAYHFAYNGTGGHASCGTESSWDIKRILGTVPVESDGSALFRIPANTPVSIQPLDDQGRALQIMRSWMVGMPGETVSCVGCHEKQNDVVPNRRTIAGLRRPSDIEPWYGPARPFAYRHEVQPVVDKYCAGCHHADTEHQSGGKKIADLSNDNASYGVLQAYVRRPGPESDYHLTTPMEYHAGTSELVQMLEKGHHNVRLDREAWQRLYTWIDLNAPYRGKWSPKPWREQDQTSRRLELAQRYAGVTVNPEAEYDAVADAMAGLDPITPIVPDPLPERAVKRIEVRGWPFDADTARAKQTDGNRDIRQTITLGNDASGNPVELQLTRIPAGRFVIGDADGPLDERPAGAVEIDRPFWMGTMEVTNAQFALFDPTHDSRYIDMSGKDQSTRGHPANLPAQPVVRISWQQAVDFCRWASEKSGRRITLPSEAQWEWACRSGTGTPLWFGSAEDDFSPFANLAGLTRRGSGKGGINPFPRVGGVDDGQDFAERLAEYRPNPWGLFDMHGSVAEWTGSAYCRYPYDSLDGRDALDAPGQKVVRGGSWRDRPSRARSAFRLGYEPYQRVFNVGFRVVCEVE